MDKITEAWILKDGKFAIYKQGSRFMLMKMAEPHNTTPITMTLPDSMGFCIYTHGKNAIILQGSLEEVLRLQGDDLHPKYIFILMRTCAGN